MEKKQRRGRTSVVEVHGRKGVSEGEMERGVLGVHARGKTGNWTGNIRGGEGREVRTRDDCRDYELIEC